MNQILKSKKGYKKENLAPKYVEIEIPKEWEIVTLGDLTNSHNSGVFKNKEFYGSGVNIVGVSDLYSHNNIDGQIFRLVQLTNEEKQDHILEEGNLIYGESSLVRTGIGKTLVVTKKGEGTYFAWHTRRLKINENAFPHFVYYMLDSTILRNSIINRATTTALTGITTKDYFNTKFPLPSLREQQKIASIISNVDNLINVTHKIIEQTISLKTGLMQKLLTKGIGHTKFKKIKWLFGKEIEIPEEWNISKIDQLIKNKGDIRTGPFGSTLKKETFVSTGIKIYGQENVIPDDFSIGNYYITKEHFKKMKLYEIKPYDILISLVGTHGKISLVPQEIEQGIINPRLLKIRFDSSKVLPKFMKIILESKLIEIQTIKFVHGLTMGILNTGILRKFLFIIPLLTEQQKISTILSNIDSQITSQTQYKEKLERLKKSLMQKLLTGEVRVII